MSVLRIVKKHPSIDLGLALEEHHASSVFSNESIEVGITRQFIRYKLDLPCLATIQDAIAFVDLLAGWVVVRQVRGYTSRPANSL